MSDEALILSPTEGETFHAGPFAIITRVPGAASKGAFEAYELGMAAATIDYHVHMTMDETIYVLEGAVEFTVAGKTYARPAGSVAFIPRGIHHGFANRGPARARVLLMFTPSRNQHEYFRELARLFSAPTLDTAALHAVQARYDQQLIDPAEKAG
jgi:mannose-6-phosphate isomerase-like protein (cupin superfamily)